ncbi:MAG: ATP-binding protein [Myxococcota bacterium]
MDSVETVEVERPRLKKGYILALTLVALTTIAGQGVVQWVLQQELSAGDTINEAGLQRMRSQRLTKAAWQYLASSDGRERAYAETRQAHRELVKTHSAFTSGELSAHTPQDDRSRAMFEALSTWVERFQGPLDRLKSDPAVAVKELAEIEQAFLPEMDRIVATLADTADSRIRRVRVVEYALALLTLLVLVLEAFLIFAPLERSLESHAKRNAELVSRLQESLSVSRDEVERTRTLRAVGTVAAGIAHDFNNSLQVILTELTLLPEEARRKLATIEDATNDAASLTSQLLALSPRDRAPTMEPVRLDQVVKGLLPMVRSLLPEPIEITLSGDEPLRVIGSGRQLRQAILNLVLNARDAMNGSGTLSIACGLEDGEAVLRLTDSGDGIPPEMRLVIFDPFFTTKPTGQGTGLGLAAVRAIVERHGGKIAVESELGRGSTFILRFPKAEQEPLVEQAPSPVTLTSATVLFVEDNPEILEGMVRWLGRLGCEVLSASGVEEARGLLSDALDIVVSDIMLTDGTGLELVESIREGPFRDLPVVLVSGYAEGVAKNLDEQTRFLRKPYTPSELREVMGQLLAPRNDLKELCQTK